MLSGPTVLSAFEKRAGEDGRWMMKHATLWKRVLNGGIAALPNEARSLPDEIVVAPIIVDGPKDDGDVSIASLSRISIPFPKFWIEGRGRFAGEMGCWGLLFSAERDGEGWQVKTFAVAGADNVPPYLLGVCDYRLDRDGSPLTPPAWRVGVNSRIEGLEDARLRTAIGQLNVFAAFTLMLLGCKNVSLDARENDPRQVRRAMKRHGGNAEKYRYHVLVVRPPGASPNTKGEEIGTMPRHVCRGHFAEYGPEFGKGLLFGKYTGRFYVPPHMKGKKENGIVEKDYAVPAPPPA